MNGYARGRLIVFEGPDDAGKTTLSKMVHETRLGKGERCVWLSFPGNQENTIGREVYRMHHDARFACASQLSLQMLHVAAHIDCIERTIIPALEEGTSVVLDRFWWSTIIYGTMAGAPPDALRRCLEVENMSWRGVLPHVVFLLQRASDSKHSAGLLSSYELLAGEESKHYPVETIDNNSTLAVALQTVEEKLGDPQR